MKRQPASSSASHRRPSPPNLQRAAAALAIGSFALAIGACGGDPSEAEVSEEGEVVESEDAVSAIGLGFCAVIFRDGGFRGPARFFRANDTRVSMTDLNDQVSSIIIGPGCALSLFDDPNFRGAGVTHFAGYHPWLQRPDVASSLRCTCTGATTAAATPANVSAWAYSRALPNESVPILKGLAVDLSNTSWNDQITSIVTHADSPVRTCPNAGFGGPCNVVPGGVMAPISTGDVSTLGGLKMKYGTAGTRILLGRVCDDTQLRRALLGSDSAPCPVASAPTVFFNGVAFTTAQAASDFVGRALGTRFQIESQGPSRTVLRVANGADATVGRIFFDRSARRFSRVELY